MNDLVEHTAVPDTWVTFYQSSPGLIITGKDWIPKFISFLYLNMDHPHCVKWYNLTGLEQY